MRARLIELRSWLGSRYAHWWRRAYDLVERSAPVSAKWGLALPRLPPRPLSRQFGGEQGTPIDRLYVERFLKRHERDRRGDVLEVDEIDDSLAASAYDCVVCVDALARAGDPRAAVTALHDALRPGGVLLVTVPGIRQRVLVGITERPDLWRLTVAGLEQLLRERFGAVEVEAYGTIRAAAALLYGVPAERIHPRELQPSDPDYEVIVCGRAVRSPSG
jgi:SAM-dependent methyltransferase